MKAPCLYMALFKNQKSLKSKSYLHKGSTMSLISAVGSWFSFCVHPSSYPFSFVDSPTATRGSGY